MNRWLRWLISLLSAFPLSSHLMAQQPTRAMAPSAGGDSSQIVHLIKADKYKMIRGNPADSSSDIHQLVGHVVLRQGTTLFTCDSAVQNTKLNQFEAFGNVHINDADSIHTWSEYLRYEGNIRKAFLKKKVKLTDGKGTLTTEDLDYDMNARIGSFLSNGRVVNGQTVLTSTEGYYYADIREVYFKKNVRLVDPEYTVATDTLLYDIDEEIATFVAPTTINDGASTIRTKSGFYNLREGVASFGERPVLQDSSQEVIADRIDFDKRSGKGIAKGNVIYKDSVQGATILAGTAFFNSNTKDVLATQMPVMILRQNDDSVYIAADTLESALEAPKPLQALDSTTSLSDSSGRLSDRQGIQSDSTGITAKPADTLTLSVSKKGLQDTSALVNARATDSIRYFKAYHKVRIFSDSLQGVCDSLYYSSLDSIFRFFRDPVIWSGNNQVTGDTIHLYTKNKKPERIDVFENGFSVSRTPESFYNQIRGNRLNGYLIDGVIDYFRAKGNAESVYYLQDDDSAYVGMNYARADAISMYFKNKELDKVTWVNGVEGTTFPLNQIPEDKKQLRNFKWEETRRPKSRTELFGQ